MTILTGFFDLCKDFTGYLNDHHLKFNANYSERYSPINLIIFTIFFILTDQDSAKGQRVHILIGKQQEIFESVFQKVLEMECGSEEYIESFKANWIMY